MGEREILIAVVLGGFITFMGYSIKYKNYLSFIPGFREENILDRDRLVNLLGGWLMGVGVLTIAIPFLSQYLGSWAEVSYTLIVAFACIKVLTGVKKYYLPPATKKK